MFNGEPLVDDGLKALTREFENKRTDYLNRKYVDYFMLLTPLQTDTLTKILNGRSFERCNLEEKMNILRLMERSVQKNHPELND